MDPALYKAAKSGNIFLLGQLIDQNPTIIYQLTPQQNTPLHIAVQFGHRNAVAEIFNKSRSLLICQNLDGDTPLHVAARCGHFHVVEFLVQEILSTSWTDIESGFNSKFEVLRQGNKDRNTALHEAVRNGHVRIAQFLLMVDPVLSCFENCCGESVLFLSARDGMRDVLNKILMSNLSPAHRGPDGQTALHASVIERHSGIMEDLLRAKPHLITESDHHGRTPLHYAASLGDRKVVKRLLQLNASTAYIQDKDGQSPLHIAAKKGHIGVIDQILCCCPDSCEILDLKCKNVLHFAVLSGKANVVRYILETAELNSLVNRADDDGNTPLHLAKIESNTWIIRYLQVNKRVKCRTDQIVFDIDKSITESWITFFKNTIWTTKENTSPPFTDKEANAKTETYRDMGQTLLVVAALITTVTFSAAFTMPGGFNSNTGEALLQSSPHLKYFIIADTIAMTCSITAACLIFWASLGSNKYYVYYFTAASLLTYIALQATSMAFNGGIVAAMPNQPYVYTMAYIIGTFFHISTCFLLYQLVRILSVCEIFHFLIIYFCRVKSRFNK